MYPHYSSCQSTDGPTHIPSQSEGARPPAPPWGSGPLEGLDLVPRGRRAFPCLEVLRVKELLWSPWRAVHGGARPHCGLSTVAGQFLPRDAHVGIEWGLPGVGSFGIGHIHTASPLSAPVSAIIHFPNNGWLCWCGVGFSGHARFLSCINEKAGVSIFFAGRRPLGETPPGGTRHDDRGVVLLLVVCYA